MVLCVPHLKPLEVPGAVARLLAGFVAGHPEQREFEEETPMAICVMFEFPGMTREQYDEATPEMNNGRPWHELSDWPVPGVLLHASGAMPDGWYVVDVWESEQALQNFGRVLAPIAEKLGIPPVKPRVFPVHDLITQ
jgi:hypothetical protein